jgi:hypothetical protein
MSVGEKHVGAKHRSMAAAVMALSIIVSAISPAVAGGERAPGISQSWVKIDQLIEAIKSHLVACSEVADKQTDLSNRCSNEKADLLSQQAKLGVSDSLINERLNADRPASPPRWHSGLPKP